MEHFEAEKTVRTRRGAGWSGVFLAMLAVTFAVPEAPAQAPPPDTDATSNADAGSSDESRRDAGDSDAKPASGASEQGSVRAEAPNLDRAERLEHYGFEGGADELEVLEEANEFLESLIEFWSSEAAAVRRYAKQIEVGAESLEGQSENSALPESAMVPLQAEATRARARASLHRARAVGLEAIAAEAKSDRALFGVRLEELEREVEETTSRSESDREDVERADEAEKEALAELEAAKREQREERDQDLKRLITERAQVLERVADTASQQSKTIRELSASRNAARDTFARRRESAESAIASISEEPSEEEARAEVDPLLRQLQDYRRAARRDYTETLVELRAAIGAEQVAEADFREAVEAREKIEERAEGLSDSELVEQRIELAAAKVKLEERRFEKARSVVSAHRQTIDLHADRIRYYNRAIEEVLPRISDEMRHEFFDLWKSENWENVAASFDEARRHTSQLVQLRVAQLKTLGSRIYSPEFWGWVIGFLWRLALIPVMFVLLRRYLPGLVHRLMEVLFRRSFFRDRATATIKFGELLRTLIWPVALYLVVRLATTYLAGTFPEADTLLWLVDLLFIYWIAMATVEVVVLPRSHRDAEGGTAPELDFGRLSPRTSGRRGTEIVDLVDIEVDHALKLVGSVRRVLVFGLLAWFVPWAISAAFGHTVLWWIAAAFFRWATLGVVYYELSTWRDEIASLFVDLAGPRIPNVAEFVDERKDRFYGVGIIAVASIYVLVVEFWLLVRRSFTETEFSQRVANFLFRKKIELKQRDQQEEAVDQERHEKLPAEYEELFEDRPLYDERYLVEREDVWDQFLEPWEEWRERPRQGSVSVTGEQGVGKSTMLNQFYRHLEADPEEHGIEPIYASLTDKIVTVDALFSYLADLFGLEEVPSDRTHLVQLLLDCEPRVVLIDDCHHFYFRKIQGFEALSALLDVVNLTDHRHYWVLTFNKYGWKYLRRVQERKHFFGHSVEIRQWSASEVQDLVDRRNEATSLRISYSDLVVSREDERASYYEVVRTANGYFRLLQEFSEGNPRVALDFWIRNLIPETGETLQVSLFRRPSLDELPELTDHHLFALTALVQHGALTPSETAEIINTDVGFCEMALDFFEDVEIAVRTGRAKRYRLSAYYYRPVISRLTNSNFLWS